MLKNIKALILILSTLVGCSDQEKESNKIIMGVSADYPPFEYVENGQLKGLDIELGYEIAKIMGKELEIKEMDFNALIPSLNSGKIDFILSSISPTPERRENLDFSIPYYHSELSLVASGDKKIESIDEENIKQLLKGKTLGVQLASEMETYAMELANIPSMGMKVLSISRIPQLLEELKAERIDFILVDRTVGDSVAAQQDELRSIPIRGEPAGSAIAVAKGSNLLPKINEAISLLKENHWLEQAKERWNP